MGGGIKPGMGISFETPPLPGELEVTGPLAATFWVRAPRGYGSVPDVAQHRCRRQRFMETGQQGAPVPVAKGWLRVSHRELDPELTLPYRPVSSPRHQAGCI